MSKEEGEGTDRDPGAGSLTRQGSAAVRPDAERVPLPLSVRTSDTLVLGGSPPTAEWGQRVAERAPRHGTGLDPHHSWLVLWVTSSHWRIPSSPGREGGDGVIFLTQSGSSPSGGVAPPQTMWELQKAGGGLSGRKLMRPTEKERRYHLSKQARSCPPPPPPPQSLPCPQGGAPGRLRGTGPPQAASKQPLGR